MMANERVLRVDVVHRCFSEGGDSILKIFYICLGTNGSVQLRGGLVPEAGTVEYCASGTWKAVCDNRWDHREAFVVCLEKGGGTELDRKVGLRAAAW